MPVVSKADLQIEYTDDGAGRPVVLIHSSVSGNRQWRALGEELRDRYRVLAVNLYGYGETTAWPAAERQSLSAQAELILAVCEGLASPCGSSAIPSAVRSRSRPHAARRALRRPGAARAQSLPPAEAGRAHEAWLETQGLRDDVESCIAAGDWGARRRRFADYWLGDGAWSAMPERRRAAFVATLPPNFYEWQAVMDERTQIEDYAAVTARTLVVSDPATRRPIREIVEILAAGLPGLVVPLPPRGRPHGAADAARARQPDRARVPRRRLRPTAPSAAGRRRSASAAGSVRRARRPCRPRPASGS